VIDENNINFLSSNDKPDKNINYTEEIPPWDDSMNMPNWKDVKNFIQDKKTPFLIIDPEIVKKQYLELTNTFPMADIYYAVKANPDNNIIDLLSKEGSNFDIASIHELDEILEHGISPDRISYGNTIKKNADIAYAYKKGVRLFACDSEDDLLALSENAPNSQVFFRILVDGSASADWPLSKKFGASTEMIKKLIRQSTKLNIKPYGLSFHVGSQQKDPIQWDKAIQLCSQIFHDLKEKDGIELKMINLGGGLPAQYKETLPAIEEYRKKIMDSLFRNFPDGPPRVIMEPGRSMVGNSGLIVSEVVMVSRKTLDEKSDKWVFLDIGKFGGLPETMTSPGEKNESIHYPIYTEKTSKKEKVILAGPTCDSMDILYENTLIPLPDDLKRGDYVYIATTGAYTSSYSSVNFNGFKPLETYVMPMKNTVQQESKWLQIIKSTWSREKLNIFI